MQITEKIPDDLRILRRIHLFMERFSAAWRPDGNNLRQPYFIAIMPDESLHKIPRFSMGAIPNRAAFNAYGAVVSFWCRMRKPAALICVNETWSYTIPKARFQELLQEYGAAPDTDLESVRMSLRMKHGILVHHALILTAEMRSRDPVRRRYILADGVPRLATTPAELNSYDPHAGMIDGYWTPTRARIRITPPKEEYPEEIQFDGNDCKEDEPESVIDLYANQPSSDPPPANDEGIDFESISRGLPDVIDQIMSRWKPGETANWQARFFAVMPDASVREVPMPDLAGVPDRPRCDMNGLVATFWCRYHHPAATIFLHENWGCVGTREQVDQMKSELPGPPDLDIPSNRRMLFEKYGVRYYKVMSILGECKGGFPPIYRTYALASGTPRLVEEPKIRILRHRFLGVIGGRWSPAPPDEPLATIEPE